MQWLIDFVNDFWDGLVSVVMWLLDGLTIVLSSVVYMIFDGFFTLVHGFISSLDLGSFLLSYASNWNLLPPQLIYLINASGLAQGLTLLSYAYVVRFTLNLIPSVFTRV
jgi:uncharacterized membrane protein YqgA involved in biofilm formation